MKLTVLEKVGLAVLLAIAVVIFIIHHVLLSVIVAVVAVVLFFVFKNNKKVIESDVQSLENKVTGSNTTSGSKG